MDDVHILKLSDVKKLLAVPPTKDFAEITCNVKRLNGQTELLTIISTVRRESKRLEFTINALGKQVCIFQCSIRFTEVNLESIRHILETVIQEIQ